MTRNRVDLPDPERPRRPTISPSRKARFTPSSTTSWSPSGLRKAWLTLCTSRRGAVFTRFIFRKGSRQPELALGAVVQRPPEKAIYQHDEQAHHHRAECRPSIIGGGGRGGDVGTEARRRQRLVSPHCDLRNDARVPRATRGGDC